MPDSCRELLSRGDKVGAAPPSDNLLTGGEALDGRSASDASGDVRVGESGGGVRLSYPCIPLHSE